jgi:hypothetical protein
MAEVPEGMAEYLQLATNTVVEAKQEWVRDGPADLPPMLVWYFTQRESMQLPLAEIVTEMEVHPVDVISQMLPQLRSVTGPPFGVLFVIEGYFAPAEKQDLRSFKRGSLAARFARGDPAVCEALTLTIVDAEDMVTRHMPFRYGDGSVIWDEYHDEVIKTRSAWSCGANVPMALASAFGEPSGGMN